MTDPLEPQDDDEEYVRIDADSMPAGQLYAMACLNVLSEPDDPEDTLQVAFTRRDLAIFAFSIILMMRMFPEMQPYGFKTNRKLMELTQAQGYLPWAPGEVELPGADDV